MIALQKNLTTKLKEFRAGWGAARVVASSVLSGAELDIFYLLGWWWEGEHVRVPQLIEEERLAAELEKTFGALPDFKFTINPNGGGIGATVNTGFATHGPVIYSNGTSTVDFAPPIISQYADSSALKISAGSKSGHYAGMLSFGPVRVDMETKPHPLRLLLLRLLFDAKWISHSPSPSPNQTNNSSHDPLRVLQKYLGSIRA